MAGDFVDALATAFANTFTLGELKRIAVTHGAVVTRAQVEAALKRALRRAEKAASTPPAPPKQFERGALVLYRPAPASAETAFAIAVGSDHMGTDLTREDLVALRDWVTEALASGG